MSMYGGRLRLRRKVRGLTQKQLGDLAGCCMHSIRNYEKFETAPNTYVGKQIAGVLGEF